ncbi:MAG TPA: carboxypeptidase regulatory-like domain-containing protein [Bryobacteraceae bacterium]|jgi:plastocyanin
MLAGLAATIALARAADIRGTIIIERKLTHYNVSAAAGIYQRGAAVGLGENPEDDPISFERAHVAVYLEGGQGGGRPGQEVSMEQKNRRFVPDMLVIPAGSTVSFPNDDPIFHNVFSLSKAKSFDLGNYPVGKTREVTFSKPGVVAVYCHLHPNMAASIVVTPSRWGTRAAADGAFSLRGVPAGSYSVVAWHKAAGTFRKQITVGDRDDIEVDFVLPYAEPPSSGSVAHR